MKTQWRKFSLSVVNAVLHCFREHMSGKFHNCKNPRLFKSICDTACSSCLYNIHKLLCLSSSTEMWWLAEGLWTSHSNPVTLDPHPISGGGGRQGIHFVCVRNLNFRHIQTECPMYTLRLGVGGFKWLVHYTIENKSSRTWGHMHRPVLYTWENCCKKWCKYD